MRKNLTVKEKQRKIRAANDKFVKKYKLEKNENVRIGILSENKDIGVMTQIKTGNVAIDVLTGGMIEDQVNVWYGGPGVGKSTQVRNMCAYTQKAYNAFHLYMNQEKTMDRNYWVDAGVDLHMLEVAEFETNEQALDMCNKCATGEKPIDILTIDTLQALSCEGELRKKGSVDKSVGDDTIALNISAAA